MQNSTPLGMNKENLVIWTAWSRMGDKEVIREAASKGTHIDLAKQFLSTRNSQRNVENWFNNEIYVWINELLNRKQIFRVKHILSNIKKDPDEELNLIFNETESMEMRIYVGNYLSKNGVMDANVQKLWSLSNIILANYELVSSFISKNFSLREFSQKPAEWHSKIATVLFLMIYDFELVQFIKPLDFWKHLLLTNNGLIKNWITVSFSKDEEAYSETATLDPILVDFFAENKINKDMLEFLTSSYSNLSQNTKDNVLKELCQHGIILEEEKEDFLKFLKRLLCLGNNRTYSILNKLPLEDQELLIKSMEDYCVKNNYQAVLSSCFMNLPLCNFEIPRNLSFLLKLQEFIKDMNHSTLRQNILDFIDFIEDYNYFEKHPELLLAFLILSVDIDFRDVFNKSKIYIPSLNLNIEENLVKLIQENYRILNVYKEVPQNCPTYYDFLSFHQKIDVKNFFLSRNRNDLPYFASLDLVNQYGLKKNINDTFVMKELCPSYASRMCFVDQIKKYGNTSQEYLIEKEAKILKIVKKNFRNKQILCSCISFCEMIGISSEKIRTTCNVYEILSKNNFENLNDGVNLFKVRENLENCILKDLNFMFDGSSFVKATNVYEIAIKFTKNNKIKTGDLFLKKCAVNNQWMAFLIYAQIKRYSIEQVKEILPYFKSPLLLEHLYHCVSHDVQCEDVLMGERDPRNSFLSRVGVRKTTDQSDQRSCSSSYHSESPDISEFDVLSSKATLLQTLIRCHDSVDPPRALLQACQIYRYPLLAVLATSYEPDSVHTNWMTWLMVSCNDTQPLSDAENIVTNPNYVAALLIRLMDNGYYRTLLESFQIFLRDNPLLHFLDFVQSLISHDSTDSLSEKSLNFKNALKKSRRASIMPEEDHELMFLDSRIWIEDLSIQLLASALENFKSIYEQIVSLDNICQINLQDIYSIEIPNFLNLKDILQQLYDSSTKTRINLKFFMNNLIMKQIIVNCLENLIDEKLFQTALTIAKICNFPPDLIVIKMWENKLKTTDSDNWAECNASLKNYNITADVAIDFYLKCAKNVNKSEEYKILKYCYEWAQKFELSSEFDLECKMWTSYINLEEKYKIMTNLKIIKLRLPYGEILDLLEKVPCFIPEPDAKLKESVEKLIGEALNGDNFYLALRLEKMFTTPTSDLEVLKLCHGLAEGFVMPYQMNVKERMLLAKSSNYRRFSSHRSRLSTRLSSYSSTSHTLPSLSGALNFSYADSTEAPIQDTLSLIQTLSEKVVNGSQIALNVLMTYRVSMNIEIPFNILVANPDYMKILKHSLDLDCMNKLEVIHDFVAIYEWSKNEISDFIAEELINHVGYSVKSKSETIFMWDMDINQHFNLVLQLLPEGCSILGHKLFTYGSTSYNAYMTSQEDVRISEVAIVIELLIRAHDCFSSDCNMEGISIILSKCQSIIAHLVTLRSWKYIVRLLIGIARYSEMTYVFQILKENDQFEYLLMKGLGKDNHLRIALLEFLKKFCPDNRDLYKMVALHFALYSEVAQLWERDAQNIIRNLIGISKLEMQNNKINPDTEMFVIFTNTDGTKLCLQKAMENYTHATEFHLQGEKLARAMQSAKQAELLAMQLSFFNLPSTETAKCLLNLENNQITNLITFHLSFEQALILVDAYNFPADWASILYEQCVILNKKSYLESYLNHLPLGDSLIRDISRKFLQANHNTPETIDSMKLILNKIPSVHSKYQIASELGFVDVVEDLITKGQLAYLKDTVWKRGYKG